MYQASINTNAPVTDEPTASVYTVDVPFGDLKLSATQWITSRDPRYFEAIAHAAWQLARDLHRAHAEYESRGKRNVSRALWGERR